MCRPFSRQSLDTGSRASVDEALRALWSFWKTFRSRDLAAALRSSRLVQGDATTFLASRADRSPVGEPHPQSDIHSSHASRLGFRIHLVAHAAHFDELCVEPGICVDLFVRR